MMASKSTSKELPSAAETLKHPSYPGTIWALEPHHEGKAAVAVGRGGPVKIAWEIHGTGPTRLVFIMGLAGVKTSWQRQVKYFGHENADTYSVLILDNRGMGSSDRPLRRYTTSDMARDVLEVVDHVGWTGAREINLVGISLGGMIAQEIAAAAPERLRSLTLLCTSARVQGDKNLIEAAEEAAGFLWPKTTERIIYDTAHQLFTDEWLEAPDAENLPVPGETPRCGPAPAGADDDANDGADKEPRPYGLFDCNFQRYQAQELTKRESKTEPFSTLGFICQLGAAASHRKTDEQLEVIADAVGRDRILVMHGTRDNMIRYPNGERLIRAIKPGVGLIVDGMGHAPIMERTQWFNSLLEERLTAWAKL